jgi:hypothetical protein
MNLQHIVHESTAACRGGSIFGVIVGALDPAAAWAAILTDLAEVTR